VLALPVMAEGVAGVGRIGHPDAQASVPLAYRLFIPYIAVASALGEIPLELWLIVMGVNAQRWKVQASAKVYWSDAASGI